jgi:acyl carrier protein
LSTITTTPANGDLTQRIREVFAQVTRYPLEILAPDASLEEDLGIDSVKLGEVFAVLREKYDLAENADIPREKLRTIASISGALEEHLKAEHLKAEHPKAVPLAAAPAAGDFRQEVQSIFASVTRYPLDVLDLNASLEEDLGIDSVKLGEVFAVMRERYGLPEKMDLSREQTKTMAGISDALAVYLGAAYLGTASAPVPAEQAPRRLNSEEISQSVRHIFADVTRYPLDILELNANLEEDLGIDSVKAGRDLRGLARTLPSAGRRTDSAGEPEDDRGHFRGFADAPGRRG